MPPRKITPRGQLPANWKYRDGRPRWEPGPSLRQAGWKGYDLKDAATGAWLSQGASIDFARAINAAVDLWRAGQPAPDRVRAIAPAGACDGGAAIGEPRAPDKLAIGRLIDVFTGDADAGVKPSEEFAKKKLSTQRDYRNKLKRLVDVLAGFLVLPDPQDAAAVAAYAAAVAEVRAASVMILEPQETPSGIVDPLHKAYWWMRREIGAHQAAGILTVASLWLSWCRQRQSRRVVNWAADVSRETPPGRIRKGTWDEIAALVCTADCLGYLSMGDAIILGLDLSWSQVDRLALTWPRVKNWRCLTGEEGRQKTGRVGGTPLSILGRARMAEIKARHEAMPAHPTHVLVCETTGQPWAASHYRATFREIRAEAAKLIPSVADFRDQDLRDTGISLFEEAGLNTAQIAGRSLQSRKNVQALQDKHYGEIGPEISDQGVALLDAYLKAQKVQL